MRLSFVILASLCAAQSHLFSALAAPQKEKAAPLHTLVDRNTKRSIEVVTDRRESLAQFFARQKVALACGPMIDLKPVTEPAQFKAAQGHDLFVSYPLFNDSGLKMFYYGTDLDLLPPSPTVLSLLKGSDVLTSPRNYLIFAFDDNKSSRPALSEPRTRRRARLVGLVRVTNDWKPDAEKELFAFSSPDAGKH